MKTGLYFFLSLFLVIDHTFGLECYTGYAIVRGRTVGTETKTCEKSSDMCYKANADMNTLIKLKLAGCSTWRCMLASNGCVNHVISGQSIELCCCSGDLCNAPESNTESLLKGLITHFSDSGNNNGGGGGSTNTHSNDDSWRNRDNDHDSGRNDDRDQGRDQDDHQGNSDRGNGRMESNADDRESRFDSKFGSSGSGGSVGGGGARASDDRSSEHSGGFFSKFFGKR